MFKQFTEKNTFGNGNATMELWMERRAAEAELQQLTDNANKCLSLSEERIESLKKTMQMKLELQKSTKGEFVPAELHKHTSRIKWHMQQSEYLENLLVTIQNKKEILIKANKLELEEIKSLNLIVAKKIRETCENHSELYFCFVDSTHLNVFNPFSLERSYRVKHGIKYIDAHTSRVLLDSDYKFFVTGSLHRPMNTTYQYELHHPNFERKANMINGRCLHAFIEFKSNILMAIGGSYGIQGLKDCEYYDIKENSWHKMSPLNMARYYHVCLDFDDNIIYVIGGRENNFSTHSSIERVQLDRDFTGKWQQIFLNTLFASMPLIGAGCLRLETRKYVIFGGTDDSNDEHTECIIFNEKEKAFSKASFKLKSKDNFGGTSIAYYCNEKFYCFSINRHLHTFNDRSWAIKKDFIIEE